MDSALQRIRGRHLSVLVALVVGLAGLVTLLPPPAQAAPVPTVGFTKVAGGLVRPVQVGAFPDGSGRVAVVQKAGTVRLVRGSSLAAGNYLDLRSKVISTASGDGEQGLLGLAFGRSFTTNPVVFVTYVRKDGALVVAKLRAYRSSSPNIRATTEQILLVIPHPTFTNHNGGSILFGRDGLLYITTGDGGGAGDPRDQARRATSLLGKVLRIDPYRTCSGRLYCVPATNPFSSSTVNRREIYLWGLRNPWRASVDQVTGDLWIGDVGQNAFEEVHRIRQGAKGANLGWPCREGNAIYDASRCGSAAYVAPVVAYCHTGAPGCAPALAGQSVTGGEVYRGKRISGLAGQYVFGDFISGNVWRLSGSTMFRITSLPLVTDFGRAADGEILAVTYTGSLYRLGPK